MTVHILRFVLVHRTVFVCAALELLRRFSSSVFRLPLKAHLPYRCTLDTIFVQLEWPVGAVTTVFSIVRAYDSDIAKMRKSLSDASFIKLCCTICCFRTFSWWIRSVLPILGGVEHSARPTKRFVWSITLDTLWDHRLALAIVVSYFSAPRADLRLEHEKALCPSSWHL